MMTREPEPGRERMADLEERRRDLRSNLALYLLRGTPPPERLPRIINQIRRTELELEVGAAPSF